MPNAHAHDVITLVTVAAADAGYLLYVPHADPGLAALFTVSYLFAGYACAGDLDLNSREYRRWGPLRFLWWPYRVLVPHRSWVSHGLILGGVIRAMYLATVTTLVVWAVAWGYSRLGPHVNPSGVAQAEWLSLFSLANRYPRSTAALLGGFILAGTTHSIADIIWSGIKRRF